MFDGICKYCKKITPKRINDYCSEYCQKASNELRTNLFESQNIKPKKCLKCGIGFEIKSSKFCSLECATAYSLIMGEIR